MRPRLGTLFGFLTLCTVLVGCGGSTTAPVSTAPPTRAATQSVTPATSVASPATAAAAIAPTAVAASFAPVPATAAAPATGGSNDIAVMLKDYAIALDKSTVSAGMVTFTVKNNGPSPHTFHVMVGGEERGIGPLDPGKTTTLTLDLPVGSYSYRCRVPGHDLLGMKGTLTVK